MAFYRAGWKDKRFIRGSSDFWKGINGNCVDIAILEWCKLFADPKGSYYWGNVVTDKPTFLKGLLAAVGPGVNAAGWNLIVKDVRTYRDKFLAHLDDDLVAKIPGLKDCKLSADYYHGYVLTNEATGLSLHGLPKDLSAYYEQKFEEAKLEYEQETQPGAPADGPASLRSSGRG